MYIVYPQVVVVDGLFLLWSIPQYPGTNIYTRFTADHRMILHVTALLVAVIIQVATRRSTS